MLSWSLLRSSTFDSMLACQLLRRGFANDSIWSLVSYLKAAVLSIRLDHSLSTISLDLLLLSQHLISLPK